MDSIKCIIISLVLLSIASQTKSEENHININPAQSLSKYKKSHALLIGITYQNRKDITHLKGPVNDVLAFKDLLQQRGFKSDDIHVLSDGILNVTQPTRKNIFQAFDTLGNTLKKDDFVFLYFGGHGSYQPTNKDITESDGQDEIFLPVDVGRWQGKNGPVKNAITDNEVGQLITNLRNREAFVWAVFDQCHAGSMTRGETGKYRYLDPKFLGVPKHFAQNNNLSVTRSEAKDISRIKPASHLSSDAGDSVIFYATQPWEIEPELEVSDGENDEKTFGMFSYRLLQILATYPQASYRQIAQQLLRRYDASASSRPTPLFTGSGLDATVFNRNKEKFVRQWPIKRIEAGLVISAGRLQQLTEGSILAIMENPAAEQALAYLKIKKAGLFRSILTAVDYNGKATLMPSNSMYARLVYTQPTLTLRINGPQYPIGNSEPESKKLRQVIKRIKSKHNNTLLKWVNTVQDADIKLGIEGNQLWLIPKGTTGIIKQGPYKNHSIQLVGSVDKLNTSLKDSLLRVAKAINILRLSSQFTNSILTDKLQITATIQRKGSLISQPFTADTLPRLHQDDLLTFTLQNNSKSAVDITLLFMDSQYGIHSWFPKTGQINRIRSGDKVTKRLLITTETLGRERMLFIVVRADQFTPLSSDFRFLAQKTLPKSRGESGEKFFTKEQNQLQALFQQAGFGETARSSQQPELNTPLSDSQLSEKALITGYSWMVE